PPAAGAGGCGLRLTGPVLAELGRLAEVLASCRDEAVVPPAAQVGRLRKHLRPHLERQYRRPEPRARDLEIIEHLAGGRPTRARLLADLTLDPPSSTADLAGPPSLDDDYLTLSTVHSAKGCEWEAVHLLNASDGMFPADMACSDEEELEEERRLFYVACTRARSHLRIYFPFRYHHRRFGRDDAHGFAQLTRFLDPDDLHLLRRSAAALGGGEIQAAQEEEAVSGQRSAPAEYGAPGWTSPEPARPRRDLMEEVSRSLGALWGR
ncbi:MAG: 3'-5' exonuclease, partial [Acidimicrobiales bacterium]